MNITPEKLALNIVSHIWNDINAMTELGHVKFNMTRIGMSDLLKKWNNEVERLIVSADRQRKYLAFFDGSSKPNPGAMTIGGFIQDPNGHILYKYAISLGEGTSNAAEYNSLIHILRECGRLGIRRVLIRGDSQLIINQVTNTWKVKDPRMKELYEKAREAMEKIPSCELMWQPRNQNKLADQLATKAHYLPTDQARIIK